MELKLCRIPGRKLSISPSIVPRTSRVAFCASPICPTTRPIASAGTKLPVGAEPARSFLRSMPWIAANHRKEGADFRADDASVGAL